MKWVLEEKNYKYHPYPHHQLWIQELPKLWLPEDCCGYLGCDALEESRRCLEYCPPCLPFSAKPPLWYHRPNLFLMDATLLNRSILWNSLLFWFYRWVNILLTLTHLWKREGRQPSNSNLNAQRGLSRELPGKSLLHKHEILSLVLNAPIKSWGWHVHGEADTGRSLEILDQLVWLSSTFSERLCLKNKMKRDEGRCSTLASGLHVYPHMCVCTDRRM